MIPVRIGGKVATSHSPHYVPAYCGDCGREVRLKCSAGRNAKSFVRCNRCKSSNKVDCRGLVRK